MRGGETVYILLPDFGTFISFNRSELIRTFKAEWKRRGL